MNKKEEKTRRKCGYEDSDFSGLRGVNPDRICSSNLQVSLSTIGTYISCVYQQPLRLDWNWSQAKAFRWAENVLVRPVHESLHNIVHTLITYTVMRCTTV